VVRLSSHRHPPTITRPGGGPTNWLGA
jgi:hypothetical protein